MNYEALWELMADLITELRNVGEVLPSKLMRDLRGAKTLIEILRLEDSRSDVLFRIEEYLANIESVIVPAAKKQFGEKYVQDWLTKITDVQRESLPYARKEPSKFPVGIPRDKKWIRLEPSQDMTAEDIRHLVNEMGLEQKIQDDGYVIVFGQEEKIKKFVKKVAQLLRKPKT